MFMWAFMAQAANPIRINILDPSVKEVYLVCPDRTVSTKVVNRVASFDENVSNCRIEVRKEIGSLPSPGAFTCATDGSGCQEEGTVHRPTQDAPGRVNIVLTDNSADMFELKCGDSRSRAQVRENVATFDNVTSSGCTLFFKGMAPAKYDGIRTGTYKCSAINAVGKCIQTSKPAPAPEPEATEPTP